MEGLYSLCLVVKPQGFGRFWVKIDYLWLMKFQLGTYHFKESYHVIKSFIFQRVMVGGNSLIIWYLQLFIEISSYL